MTTLYHDINQFECERMEALVNAKQIPEGFVSCGDIKEINPAMSRWLMGYPAAWDHLAPGYESWRRWQDFLSSLSKQHNETEGGG